MFFLPHRSFTMVQCGSTKSIQDLYQQILCRYVDFNIFNFISHDRDVQGIDPGD